MIQVSLKKVVEGIHLTREEAYETMKDIMNGNVLPTQIAAYLVALRMKSESIDEIVGSALAMRDFATAVTPKSNNLVDTCGTGGDASGTFNISTAAAIVAASAGVKVAKHGNRAVSSKSGSADVLQALGVNILLDEKQMADGIDEVGISFLFAQSLHPAMKNAINPRKEIGVRTIFNMLGPLTNPAKTKRQVIGVFHPMLTEVFADVLKEMGSEHILAVHGEGGFDEMSVTGSTKITELKDGEIRTIRINPFEFRMKNFEMSDLLGGSPEENAEIIIKIFDGKKEDGARAAVALNAGAAIYISGMASSLVDGYELAQQLISEKKALQKLHELVLFSNKNKA